MREYAKVLLSKIWPFSRFMRRIQDLHLANAELRLQLNRSQEEILAGQRRTGEQLREIADMQRQLYTKQEAIALQQQADMRSQESKRLHIASEPQIEQARQLASNYKYWRTDHFINEVINHPERFDEIESLFSDEDSLETLHWIIIFRFLAPILGDSDLWCDSEVSMLYRIFPGPVSEELYQKTFAQAEAAAASQSLALFAEPYCIWHTFILKQYQYDDIFRFKEGDVVFDIGGYVGDTALFFSELVGETGTVYTFEPSPGNADCILENAKHFGRKNIRLECLALSDFIGECRFSETVASGATFSDEGVGVPVKTTTIDKFVADNQIEKLSVIKMDVEGAEDSVLRGGLDTIRRLRPILLVSVYHSETYGYGDFTKLTLWLKNVLPGYQFYLRHKNAQLYETVLICIPVTS